MKILLIAPTFGLVQDNSHQAMMSAYKSAIELSKKAHVIVLAAGPKPRYEKIHPRLEVYRLWNLYLKDPVNYMIPPGILLKTVQLIFRERPDVVLVNKFMFFNAFVIPLLRLLGQKVYTQIDAFPSVDWISRTPWIRPIMWGYLRFIGLPLLWLSHCVILFHEGMVPIAERFKIKYRVIHNGVNLKEFERTSIAREVQPTHPNQVNIGFVGRLESMKGYDVLLKVCQELLPSHPHVKLFMIGNTYGKESIIKRYASKQICFLGLRNDVPALLKGIDIFVLPSFSEGLSNSLMEAMAAGCAVITMDTKGGNQILIQPGVNGLLARLNHPEDLKEKIRFLIEHPEERSRLGAAAKKKIQQSFDWDVIREQYLTLFQGSQT